MLEGIKIIKTLTETKYTYGIINLIGGIALLVVGLILLSIIIVCITDLFKHKKIDDLGSFIMCVILGVFLILSSISTIGNYFTRTQYTTTKYQVIIDDNVKYNDFVNRYDIISHDGDIYTIKDKLTDEFNK